MIQVNLEIQNKLISVWSLPMWHYFTLTPTGFDQVEQRFSIYQKVSHTKSILISVPEKPKFSIPQLTWRTGWNVYPVLETYAVTKI